MGCDAIALPAIGIAPHERMACLPSLRRWHWKGGVIENELPAIPMLAFRKLKLELRTVS